MNSKFYIEVNCQQKNHDGERICGDAFLSKRINEENRIIIVLSDGMGHGVKANILATLTATMALNFTKEHKDFKKIAEIIMKTLPVCKERKVSYATFTIIDINIEGEVHILEYENPRTLILRNGEQLNIKWNPITLNNEVNGNKKLYWCSFKPQKEDRLFFWSDGIPQSGTGSDKYPTGWGIENANKFIIDYLKKEPTICAAKIATKVINKAFQNDGFQAKDDTSCASIYFRKPRKLLITTGPPFEENRDIEFATKFREFDGKKIICGATTGDILSRELNLEITDSTNFDSSDLPPISYMDGVDLITEGILTLSKVNKILKKLNPQYKLGNGPADKIVKLIKQSDEIHFLIGTRINIAHQDPNMPIELEMRRSVIRRIAQILEEKFLKEVKLEFI